MGPCLHVSLGMGRGNAFWRLLFWFKKITQVSDLDCVFGLD